VTAYRAVPVKTAFVEPMAVGDELPSLTMLDEYGLLERCRGRTIRASAAGSSSPTAIGSTNAVLTGTARYAVTVTLVRR